VTLLVVAVAALATVVFLESFADKALSLKPIPAKAAAVNYSWTAPTGAPVSATPTDLPAVCFSRADFEFAAARGAAVALVLQGSAWVRPEATNTQWVVRNALRFAKVAWEESK
jgi:hypothetical protein